MGCNNSHLRPLFRRCRRRSKKDSSENQSCVTPKRQNVEAGMTEGNHLDYLAQNDVLHGFQFIGSSMKQSPNKVQGAAAETTSASDQPSCVLLAQSELSNSQLDFFRMLDEKIQQGPDYDSEEDRIDTERLISRNIQVWKTTIENSKVSGWKVNYGEGSGLTPATAAKSSKSSSRAGNTSKYNRCQWEEEGDA